MLYKAKVYYKVPHWWNIESKHKIKQKGNSGYKTRDYMKYIR